MIFNNIKLSISKRLTLIYSSILLLILITFTLITFFSIRNLIIKDSENILSSNTEMIFNYISNIDRVNEQSLRNLNLSQDIFLSVFDIENNLVYSNKLNTQFVGKHKKDKKVRNRNMTIQREDETIFASKEVNNKGTVYYIQVEKSYDDIGKKTGALQEILVVTSILGTLVSFVSGSFLSKKLLKPIQDISDTAKEITSKSLDKRIITEGPDDELKDLAETFNSMIERLEMDFEKQRRFVSDASHELRTPLSVIYGHVNMLNRWGKDDSKVLKNSLGVLKKETDNMNRLIENLLYLAKSDNNVFIIKREEFSVNSLLKEIVNETVLNYSQFQVSYICENQLRVNGDYNAIKQLLRILVDNSVKYSTPPGEIEIIGEEKDNGILFIVKDKGIGIPAESLPYIFDRFYRVDESRTKATGGTGLGLSIAKQIVNSHNGIIYAESEIEKGTVISVYIPN